MKKIIFGILISSIIIISWCGNSSSNNNKITWRCIDVTSYDRNRNNDMKCTSSAWEVRYTSYEWAKVLESL